MLNISLRNYRNNVIENCKASHKWLDEIPVSFTGSVAIIGGAPSIKKRVGQIRALKKSGVMIWAVNGTHDWLLKHGIRPDFFTTLDARACNDFAKNPILDCAYIIASQCSPKTFKRLKGQNVLLWHVDNEHYPREKIKKYAQKRGLNSIDLTSPKGCVTLTTACLGANMGFENIILFGVDSSFHGTQHAYSQIQNENDETIEVHHDGQSYTTTPTLLKQIEACAALKVLLHEKKCTLQLECGGLMAAMME